MFYTEENGYTKTSLSDLQGAWENFRETLLSVHPFENSERILFHTNEAMSWEVVRDLIKMKNLHLLISNIIVKTECHDDLAMCLDAIGTCLDEAVEEYGN